MIKTGINIHNWHHRQITHMTTVKVWVTILWSDVIKHIYSGSVLQYNFEVLFISSFGANIELLHHYIYNISDTCYFVDYMLHQSFLKKNKKLF